MITKINNIAFTAKKIKCLTLKPNNKSKIIDFQQKKDEFIKTIAEPIAANKIEADTTDEVKSPSFESKTEALRKQAEHEYYESIAILDEEADLVYQGGELLRRTKKSVNEAQKLINAGAKTNYSSFKFDNKSVSFKPKRIDNTVYMYEKEDGVITRVTRFKRKNGAIIEINDKIWDGCSRKIDVDNGTPYCVSLGSVLHKDGSESAERTYWYEGDNLVAIETGSKINPDHSEKEISGILEFDTNKKIAELTENVIEYSDGTREYDVKTNFKDGRILGIELNGIKYSDTSSYPQKAFMFENGELTVCIENFEEGPEYSKIYVYGDDETEEI